MSNSKRAADVVERAYATSNDLGRAALLADLALAKVECLDSDTAEAEAIIAGLRAHLYAADQRGVELQERVEALLQELRK